MIELTVDGEAVLLVVANAPVYGIDVLGGLHLCRSLTTSGALCSDRRSLPISCLVPDMDQNRTKWARFELCECEQLGQDKRESKCHQQCRRSRRGGRGRGEAMLISYLVEEEQIASPFFN